jgi:hypothetical protein
MHETRTAIATGPLATEARRIRLAFCLTAAAILAAILFGFAAALLQDPDSWWHVKVGLDLMAARTFPTVDTYSHTFAGHPWIAKEWLGQALLTLGYVAGGWNGVALLTIAAIALTAFLLSWHLSDALKPTVAIGVTFAVAFLVGPIYTARPHIFTLPIIVAWSACLFRAARNEQAPPLWLLPLLCLWANLHATFTFGFIIAAFAGLDLLWRIRLSNPPLLAKWIAFGVLCPLVSLLNPYGVKAILATFTVAYGNEAVPFITEWQPFDASQAGFQEAVLLLSIFGLLVSGPRIGWPKALFVLFALHVYLIHARFIYVFFLLVPIVVAHEIAEQYPSISARAWIAAPRDGLERFFARYLYPLGGAITVLLICIAAIFMFADPVEPSRKTSAKEALAFAEKNHLSGNIFNSYDFGGTLIFHGIKTFIDGRTDQLFLDGFTTTNEATQKPGGKPVLEEQLTKYAVDWALLTADDPRIGFFDEMANWKRVYSDEDAVIYTRNN